MSLRIFSFQVKRNTASLTPLLRQSSCSYTTAPLTRCASLQANHFQLSEQAGRHRLFARPASTGTSSTVPHDDLAASSVEPAAAFLDELRVAYEGRSIMQVKKACKNYIWSHSRTAVHAKHWENRKPVITAALHLLSSSGDPEDMKLAGSMLNCMHNLWGLRVDASFYDEVLQVLVDGDRLVSALKWLEDMPDKPGQYIPSRQQWDRFLLHCKTSQHAKLILPSLDVMRRTGCPPNADTYWILFEALFQDGEFPRYAQVHKIVKDMKRDNVPFTRAVLDLLVEGYENAGSAALVAEVTNLYETLRNSAQTTAVEPHTSIDRNSMLGHAAAQDKVGAVRLLNAYIQKGFRPTRDTLVAVSEAANRVSDLVFWEKKLGIEADADIWAIVIQNAAFGGSATDRYNALEAYRTVGRRGMQKTVETFYPLLRAICTTSDRAPSNHVIDLSLSYLKDFLQDSDPHEHRKSLPIYNHLLRAVTMSRHTRKYLPVAMTLVEDLQSRGVPLDPIATTSVVIMIMNCCQDSAEAYEIYKKLHRTTDGRYALDAEGYEAVVNNFCKRSFQPEDVDAPMYFFDMLKDMRSAGYPIRPKAYSNVLRRLSSLIESLHPEEDSARIQLIGTVRRIHEVITLDGSLVPDVALWNQLMETYQRFGCFRESYQLWQTMFLSGDFNSETVSIIIDACMAVGEDEKVVEVYRKLRDRKFTFDLRNWHSWLERLCRIGKLDDAVKALCLEMSQLSSVQPTEETVRIILRYASLTNQEDEIRSRIRRYLPDLWSTLPNSIRKEPS